MRGVDGIRRHLGRLPSRTGTWRAAYAGSGTYLALTGSGDYVDVR